MKLIWTPHPIFQEPTVADIQALAARSNCAPEIAAEMLWKRRQEANGSAVPMSGENQ